MTQSGLVADAVLTVAAAGLWPQTSRRPAVMRCRLPNRPIASSASRPPRLLSQDARR